MNRLRDWSALQRSGTPVMFLHLFSQPDPLSKNIPTTEMAELFSFSHPQAGTNTLHPRFGVSGLKHKGFVLS